MIRRRYHFTGKVQHVGFRWRAGKAAKAFGCSGWCRNNPDGSVTMEIQGTRAQIDLVLLAIRSGRYIRIEHTDIETLMPDQDERDFRTEY